MTFYLLQNVFKSKITLIIFKSNDKFNNRTVVENFNNSWEHALQINLKLSFFQFHVYKDTQTYTHTHTRTHIYIYVYIIILKNQKQLPLCCAKF